MKSLTVRNRTPNTPTFRGRAKKHYLEHKKHLEQCTTYDILAQIRADQYNSQAIANYVLKNINNINDEDQETAREIIECLQTEICNRQYEIIRRALSLDANLES